MSFTFQLRRGTSLEWMLKDPILKDGEPGIERDTAKIKIGTGITRWSELPYSTSEPNINDTPFETLYEDILDPTWIEPEPPPGEDDGLSFTLLYENAKV